MASIAESFRSTCGSERGAPQCTTQRRPAATPHVGHGTDDNCFVVSSFFPVENCPMTPYRKTIPFGTLLGTSRSPGESQLLLLLINALPESSRVHSGCIIGNAEVISRKDIEADFPSLERGFDSHRPLHNSMMFQLPLHG